MFAVAAKQLGEDPLLHLLAAHCPLFEAVWNKLRHRGDYHFAEVVGQWSTQWPTKTASVPCNYRSDHQGFLERSACTIVAVGGGNIDSEEIARVLGDSAKEFDAGEAELTSMLAYP